MRCQRGAVEDCSRGAGSWLCIEASQATKCTDYCSRERDVNGKATNDNRRGGVARLKRGLLTLYPEATKRGELPRALGAKGRVEQYWVALCERTTVQRALAGLADKETRHPFLARRESWGGANIVRQDPDGLG
jgi:hypothetical protein